MDKPITKESIDKKLGFDFTTYDDGIRTDTECDVELDDDPLDILTVEELDFIIEYYREKKKNREIIKK